MNVYDILRMRPVTAQSAASAVFGQRAPAAPPVPVTNVNSLFSRAMAAHSVVDPSIDNRGYGMGQYGSGLNGLGGFGSFGELLFGKYNFASQCATFVMKNQQTFNWLKQHGNDGGAGYFTDIDFEAPDAALLQRAAQGYEYLKTEAEVNDNVAAQVELDQLDSSLKSAMAQVDALADVKNASLNCDDPRARPWSAQESLYDALSIVVQQLKKFASAPSRIRPVALTTGGGTTSTGGGSAQDNITASLLAKAQQEVAEAHAAAEAAKLQQQMQDQLQSQQKQQAAAAVEGGLPAWAAPVGVLAAVGIAAVFILKKKRH